MKAIAYAWRQHKGFTLVEMLAVMGIIILLIGLLGPPIGTMVRGPLITQAADKLAGFFNLARQTATARNQAVEVRFYQYADPSVPGESAANPSSGKYRALQLLLANNNGTVTPLSAVETLPVGVIGDSGQTLSTLLAARPKSWTANDPQLSLPRPGKSYNCSSFRFRPDGSTDLTNGSWFITLHHVNDGDPRTAPPANYVTIQIDPFNGATTVYRP